MKNTITITRTEFLEAANKVMAGMTSRANARGSNPMSPMSATVMHLMYQLFTTELQLYLFSDEEQLEIEKHD